MKKKQQETKETINRFWLGIFIVSISALVVFPFQVYSKKIEAGVSIDKAVEITPNEKVAINFSLPVLTSSVEKGVSVFPAQEVSFKWENGNKRLLILPKGSWRAQAEYVIRIENGKNIFLKDINKTIDFKTQEFPKVDSFLPITGEKNVAVDIEDPVRINFDRSLEGFNVKFVVSPEKELGWQMNDEKTQISLLATDNFKWETKYQIAVFVKNKQQVGGEFVKIGETFFTTAAAPAPEVWDKNPEIRAQQAKKFTTAKIQDGKYIDINISKQTMVIFENGVTLDAFVISSGKKGMDTPEGSFSIQNKAPRVWSKKYSLFMPYWMAIIPSGEVGIHELPEWPGGYKEGAAHLGIPVSHGCVRLGVGSAKRVYDWAEIGTPVVVYR